MKACVSHDELNHNEWGVSCKNCYMWNPSMCDCKCNKSCKIGECLNAKKCSCTKHVIGKFV